MPRGTIAGIRNGTAVNPDADERATVTNTMQAPLVAEAINLAMHSIAPRIQGLPKPRNGEFTPQISAILADLRKLVSVATNAARVTKGTPAAILALRTVRRTYNDVMLLAAKSPTATAGQRLYTARHQANLSIEEAANAAGLSPEVVTAVEEEREIPQDAVERIETLIAHLSVD